MIQIFYYTAGSSTTMLEVNDSHIYSSRIGSFNIKKVGVVDDDTGTCAESQPPAPISSC